MHQQREGVTVGDESKIEKYILSVSEESCHNKVETETETWFDPSSWKILLEEEMVT